MALKDFITGRTNRIVIGSVSGVGLILATATAIFSTAGVPALRVESALDGDRYWEVSDHGAIGVGTGGTAFGTAGDCLKSGGSSGAMMSFGSCGSGGGGTSVNTGAILDAGNSRFVNVSGDTMTGALNFLVTGGTNNTVALELPHTASGRILHAQDLLRSSGALALDGGFYQDGLADCDNAGEKPVYNLATGKWTCGTDDDVPESGDFANAGDLDADGTITDGVIDKADLTVSTDFGEVSTDGSSNLTIDADVIGQSEVTGNSLDFAELQAALDVDEATTITLGANGLQILATSTGEFETIGTASGRVLHAQDALRSSGSLLVDGSSIYFNALTCSGSNGGALTIVAGQVVCSDDDSGAGGSGRLTGTGANTQLAFFNNTSGVNLSGTTLMTWNQVTRQLAINGATPKARLTVVGSGAFTGTLSGSALNIQGDTSYILGPLGVGTTTTTDPGGGAGGANGVSKIYVKDSTANKHPKVIIDAPSNGGGWVQFLSAGTAVGDMGFSVGSNLLGIVTRSTHPIVLYTGGGNEVMRVTEAGGLPFMGVNKTSPAGQLHVVPWDSGQKGLIVQGKASQSGNLQEWQNSAGTVLSFISSSGYMGVNNSTLGADGVLQVGGNLNGVSIYAPGGVARLGNIEFSGGLYSALDSNSRLNINANDITFNPNAADKDFIFKGDTDTTLLYIDASTDRVGIGTASPKTKLEVNGTMSGAGLTVNGRARMPRPVNVTLCGGATACATGSGAMVNTPVDLNNHFLSGATIGAAYGGTTGLMQVQIRNMDDQVDLFSTPLALGSTRTYSGSVVINQSANTVTTNDRLLVNVSSVHTTPAKGVTITLYFWPK